ncbi:MAG: hypothetical protein Q8S33_05495 [Myxococcales bacterium]|nr:hypothetical protein [Myxococcales bacterium]
MKKRRAELRERVKASKAQTEAALANNPAVQKARRRRRLKRIASLALLLLLLLLIRCEGEPGEPVAAGAPDAGRPEEKVAVTKAVPTTPWKKPLIPPKPVPRPDFDTPSRLPAAWVDEFRLQVAARSPRLSACFIGTNRPGALRWTTLVSLQTGAVGNHDFEPMGAAADLTRAQLDCLADVLAKPGYRLSGATAEGLPERVSLVLEF